MVVHSFDRLGLHFGTHANHLRAEWLMEVSVRALRVLDRLGVAHAEDRELMGIGPVSRRGGFLDYPAGLHQFRCGVNLGETSSDGMMAGR